MKKDRNRPESLNSDHSLPRSSILRGRNNFRRLFEKSTVLNSNSIQFRFRIYDNPDEGCKVGFAAPKKIISKAVHRNRIKRLLREVYRTRQSQLRDLFNTGQFGFHGLIMAKKNGLTYGDISDELGPLIKQVSTILEAYLQNTSGQSETTT
jgi:ribonuclease P protein component